MDNNSVRDLHWNLEKSLLYFEVSNPSNPEFEGRLQVDLTTGEVTKAQGEPEREKKAATETRSRRGGVGRARQRTSIKSEDGSWQAVYRNNNVHIEPIDQRGDAGPLQVTTDGEDKFRYGTACWVYGEELDQQDAMWFSPDSKRLAFYQIDERHMKTYFLTLGNTEGYTTLHTEQYPIAGADNPHVALLIYDIESKSTTPIKIEGPKDQYIFNIRFSPSGKELIFSRTNRWQNKLDVMAADVETGETREIVSETQETWQNNQPLMRFLDDGERFIWETERNGWKHYELRHLDGRLLNSLSEVGQYPCNSIVDVDEKSGWLYFTAFSGANPLNTHLHRVKLDGSNHARLTKQEFSYDSFQISDDDKWFVAGFQKIDSPTCYSLFNMECTQVASLALNTREAAIKANIEPAELFSFTANDGKTTVYGTLQKPINFDPSRKYPLLVSVYGGPHSVGVTNRYLPGNSLCQYGFLVATIGNRGTMNLGKEFESANYLKLGQVDLDDQASGVQYLAQRDYVDGSKVGIYGTSYGGYMSALALLRYPDVFHVGVAGAPVTDWKNYDTIYTERYMRTPQENPEGYKIGSCMEYVEQLEGKLYLMHGLVDDNVHPSNVWQLAEKLQVAGMDFDMMIYPNSAHGGFPNSQAVRMNYFIRHLNAEPVEIETTN